MEQEHSLNIAVKNIAAKNFHNFQWDKGRKRPEQFTLKTILDYTTATWCMLPFIKKILWYISNAPLFSLDTDFLLTSIDQTRKKLQAV